MPKTLYNNLSEVNELQTAIMKFIDLWVHEKKTPVPRSKIIQAMEVKGTDMPTTRYALLALQRKGFIRQAVTISNKTTFVQLRRV